MLRFSLGNEPDLHAPTSGLLRPDGSIAENTSRALRYRGTGWSARYTWRSPCRARPSMRKSAAFPTPRDPAASTGLMLAPGIERAPTPMPSGMAGHRLPVMPPRGRTNAGPVRDPRRFTVRAAANRDQVSGRAAVIGSAVTNGTDRRAGGLGMIPPSKYESDFQANVNFGGARCNRQIRVEGSGKPVCWERSSTSTNSRSLFPPGRTPRRGRWNYVLPG